MTVRAIAGLAAANAAFAVMGLTVLWALRGFRTWAEVLRLTGLAYLVGLAAFGVVWTQLLVLGIPFSGWGIVISLATGIAVAGGVGTRLGRRPPRGLSTSASRSSTAVLVTAAGVALVGVLARGAVPLRAPPEPPELRRVGVLGAEGEGDLLLRRPRRGGVHEHVPTRHYPPLLPILDATAFHAMGAADPVTFHLQFWFLVVGGVAAIAGCLHAPRSRLAPVAVAAPRRWSCRASASGSSHLRPTSSSTSSSSSACCCRPLDARRRRMATRPAARPARGGGAHEARRAAVCRRVRRRSRWSRRGHAGGAAWPRLASAAVVVVAAALPWRLWYGRAGDRGEAPPASASRVHARSSGRLAPALVGRALRTRSGRSCRSSRASRSPRRASGATAG